jgi:hypothetical protein
MKAWKRSLVIAALLAGGSGTWGCGSSSNGTGAAGSSGGGSPGNAGHGGSGAAGTTGSAGVTGAAGTTGSAGATGQGGTSGATGAAGQAGGSAGATGVAGAGGSSGTAGVVGTGGAGPVSCASLPFCDDFESRTAGQPPDPQKWTVDLLGGNGVVQVDGSRGHASSKSLHVNGNSQFHTMAQVTGAPVFPLPAGILFGRAYLLLPGAMPSGHVIWIEAGAVMNDTTETRFGANIGQLDINHWPGDQEQRAPGTGLSANAWHCVEFMFDSTHQEARIWLDSTELTDLHVTNWVAPMQQNGNNTTPLTNWSPTYAAVRFGWELNGAEIWYDDVALGYTRIGCLAQ